MSAKGKPKSEPSNAELIRFARDVIWILKRAGEDWGADELGEIANAAANNGIDLRHSSGDEDL